MTNPPHITNNDNEAPRHAAPETSAQASKKRHSVIILSVVLVALLVVVGAGIGYMVWQKAQLDEAAAETANTPVPEAPASSADTQADTRVENPIDFVALKAENPDVYAWIYVPNTNINLPVLQHLTDDNFYLDHNRYGQSAIEGAIYSQSMNATGFSDPVTVLYGHNLLNNTMFTQLHYFENADFFAQNDTFYLYTPGHILTYRVVSAYQYDDRHIMNSFDFTDATVLQKYFDYVANPDALIANVREGASLSADTDKVVQLSTCVSGSYSDRRYIVSGVLVDDQKTY